MNPSSSSFAKIWITSFANPFSSYPWSFEFHLKSPEFLPEDLSA